MFVLFFILVQSNITSGSKAPSDTSRQVGTDSTYIFPKDTSIISTDSLQSPLAQDTLVIPRIISDTTNKKDTNTLVSPDTLLNDTTVLVLPDTSINDTNALAFSDTVYKDTTTPIFPDTIPLLKASDILLQEVSGFETESEISFSDETARPGSKSFIITYETKDSIFVRLKATPLSELYENMMLSGFNSTYSAIFNAETQKSRGTGLIKDIDLPINFPKPIAGIIGQGGKLDVSGSQRVELGGNKSKNFDLKPNEQTHESWFPNLTMKQHLTVDLKGTIGEKVNVYINHDSEREFELDNTIKLEYKGDEDEIIQSINAGNTELSLPGVLLIGGSTPHKGLFGIKSQAKIGPLSLTTIASREATENQSTTWSGGGKTTQEIKIEDVDFVKARFFALLPPKYVKSLTDRHDIYSGNFDFLPQQILDFKVYRNKKDQTAQDATRAGTAFDIPIDSTVPDTSLTNDYRFVQELENSFFILDTAGIGNNLRLPILHLNYSLYSEDLLAVRWTYKDRNDSIYTVGTYDSTQATSIQNAQVIKRDLHQGPADTSYVSWWYELKNRYSLGSDSLDLTNFNIKIYKHSYGGGVDEEIDPNNDNKPYATLLGLKDTLGNLKNVIDTRYGGLIVFPQNFPFIDTVLTSKDPIYNKPDLSPDKVQPKYYIWMQYKGTTRDYSLGMMNIMPGSEVIKVGGVLLKSGEDYDIDYDIGHITFKTPLVDNPNANISADFQYVPFFQAASKNLLGMRGETKIGETGQLSSAFIYYSTNSFDTRPRLGSEPTKILLGELVGSASYKPDFLTKLADGLPLVNASAPSSFTIQGNVGTSLPDANTKGEVYIDDMEGAKSSTSLGVTRGDWILGSKPTGIDENGFAHPQWYNPDNLPDTVLYPNLSEQKRKDTRPYLVLKIPSSDSWRYGTTTPCWTTLQTCLSERGMNFAEEQYVEIWVKGDSGKLHLDIGSYIPEDAMRRDVNGHLRGRDTLNTEDTNGDRIFSTAKDVGLDGVAGTDGNNISGDDGNDDWAYDPKYPYDYSHINGTEGNGNLDGEDLDKDSTLDDQSDFFTYSVDLSNPQSDSCHIDERSGWHFFRIPLTAFETNKVGAPQWEYIRYSRLWIEQISPGYEVAIAALDVVGNKWKHKGSDNVTVATKNTNEDPDYNANPAPVKREKDSYGRLEQEQSLVLKYENLLNIEGSCYTTYSVPRSFIQYKNFSFWTRGTGDAQLFIRLIGDNFNFYEYRDSISTNWEEIKIDFDAMAQLKLTRDLGDTSTIISSDGHFRICGDPSITNVSRIELGVIADSSKFYSGEIYFDELRLSNVRRDVGVAGTVGLTCGISDFASLNLSYTSTSPYFKSLAAFSSEAGRMATNSQKTVVFNGGFKADRFLPAAWGFSLPINFGITNGTSAPIHKDDILLNSFEQKKETSLNKQRSFGLSNISKTGSKNPFLRLTLDNLKGAFNYSDNASNLPTRIDSSSTHTSSASYGYSPNLPVLKIKNFAFTYFPKLLSIGGSYTHSEARKYTIIERTDTLNHTTKLDTIYDKYTVPGAQTFLWNRGIEYKPINPLSFSYSSNHTKDLYFDRKDKEIEMNEHVGVGFNPSLFGIISPGVSYSAGYGEDHSKMLDSVRNVSTTNSITYTLPVNLYKIITLGTKVRNEKLDSLAKPLSFNWSLIQIEKLVGTLQNPSLSYSISKGNTFFSLIDRPSYKYRWGFEERPDTRIASDLVDHSSLFNQTKSYGVTGIGISIKNISLRGSASRTLSDNAKSGSNITTSCQTQYPNFSFDIGNIEKFFLFKKLFNSFNAGYTYALNTSESGSKVAINSVPVLTSTSENTNISYEINGEFKDKTGARASINVAKGREELRTETGNIIASQKISYSFSLNRSINVSNGIKFPGLYNVKLKSNLDAKVTTDFSIDTQENAVTKEKKRDMKSIKVSPQLNYNFSESVTGGATAFYTQQWSKIGAGGNLRDVGINFSVEFAF
ncbi:MAG: hypothetical protein PHX21_02415 [bacterium]|nr:hypothetical protein [bacterium]